MSSICSDQRIPVIGGVYLPIHRLLGDFVSTAHGDIYLTATDVGDGPAIEIQLDNGCYLKCGVNLLVGVASKKASGGSYPVIEYRVAHKLTPHDKVMFACAEDIYNQGGRRECAASVNVLSVRKLKSVALYAINEFAELFVNNVLCMTSAR